MFASIRSLPDDARRRLTPQRPVDTFTSDLCVRYVAPRLGLPGALRNIASVWWRRGILATSAFAVASCSLWESNFPEAAVVFRPPAQYRIWWDILESCSGRRGDFDGITWFKAPYGEIKSDGHTAFAAWYENGNRIALSRDMEWPELVRHEMLHAVLQDGSHPDAYFKGRCGDFVMCGRDCPGPSVPDNPIPIALGDVSVDVEVFPKVPSLSRHEGNVTFVVKVTNTTSHNAYIDLRHLEHAHCAARVLLMSAQDADRSALVCSYVGFGGLPRLFAGNETRSVLLDVRLQHLTPGAGPFFAEPLVVAAVLADNVRRMTSVTVRP
jgi:hypothetical protein